MVELVDTLVLEASVERHASSSLAWGTKNLCTGGRVIKCNGLQIRKVAGLNPAQCSKTFQRHWIV